MVSLGCDSNDSSERSPSKKLKVCEDGWEEKKKKKNVDNLFGSVSYHPENGETDLLLYMDSLLEELVAEIKERVKQCPIKWYMNAKLTFHNPQRDEKGIARQRYIDMVTTEEADDPREQVKKGFAEIGEEVAKDTKDGSGWSIELIKEFRINIFKYEPLVGSSFIELPEDLRRKYSLTNVRNKDDQKCFLWSVLAHLHPVENRKCDVWGYRKYEKELNTTDIKFPMTLDQIGKFEKLNQLTIHVFGYKNGYLFHRRCSEESFPRVITLLLFAKESAHQGGGSDGENEHYCLINNFDGLAASLRSNHSVKFHCLRCIVGFNRPELLIEHQKICGCKFRCLYCISRFRTRELLIKHRETCLMAYRQYTQIRNPSE